MRSSVVNVWAWSNGWPQPPRMYRHNIPPFPSHTSPPVASTPVRGSRHELPLTPSLAPSLRLPPGGHLSSLPSRPRASPRRPRRAAAAPPCALLLRHPGRGSREGEVVNSLNSLKCVVLRSELFWIWKRKSRTDHLQKGPGKTFGRGVTRVCFYFERLGVRGEGWKKNDPEIFHSPFPPPPPPTPPSPGRRRRLGRFNFHVN